MVFTVVIILDIITIIVGMAVMAVTVDKCLLGKLLLKGIKFACLVGAAFQQVLLIEKRSLAA